MKRVFGRHTRRSLRGEEDVRAGARHPAGADGRDRRADEADDVVDRIARLDVPPGEEISTRIGASDCCASATRRSHVVRAMVVDVAEQEYEARLERQLVDDAFPRWSLRSGLSSFRRRRRAHAPSNAGTQFRTTRARCAR